MISTASPALNACSAGDPASSQPARVAAAQTSTAGTNTPQIRSATRWIAAFCAWACSTSLISRASWVSRPTLTARTTSRPVSTTVPPVTLSPSAASPGTDSPVIIERSTAVWPNSTSPSAAMVSPGRTTNRSPGRSRVAGTWRSVPSGSSRHTSLAAGGREVAHRLAGDAPGAGLVQPSGQQEGGDRGGGLQVDAAAGVVDQPLPERAAGAAAVEHEHRVDRPAAGGDDAERHQGVHRGRAVPGVLQRGPVERPRAPQRHRRRAGRRAATASRGTAATGPATASATGRSAG